MESRELTSERPSRRICRWFDDRMGLYLDGLLGGRALRKANQHLDECAECRRRAAFLERCLAASHRLSPLRPRPDFEEDVWERIRISRELARRPGGWRSVLAERPRLVWGGALATAAVGVALVLAVGPRLPGAGGPSDLVADRGSTRAAATVPHALEPLRRDLVPPGVRRSPAEFPPETALAAAGGLSGRASTSGEPTSRASRSPGAPVYGRLEPTSPGEEFSVEQIQRIPVPGAADGGYTIVRQVVVTPPGDGRVSF